jgi:Family of unknown function (DUF6152)
MNFVLTTKLKLALLTALICTSAPAALAHHSFAMYDNSKSVALDGVVRSFKWGNPHGQIILTVVQRGTPVDYAIELSSLNSMSRQGWTRNSVRPGERVRVTIHPMKDGTNGGSFAGGVKADGTVLRATAPR